MLCFMTMMILFIDWTQAIKASDSVSQSLIWNWKWPLWKWQQPYFKTIDLGEISQDKLLCFVSLQSSSLFCSSSLLTIIVTIINIILSIIIAILLTIFLAIILNIVVLVLSFTATSHPSTSNPCHHLELSTPSPSMLTYSLVAQVFY